MIAEQENITFDWIFFEVCLFHSVIIFLSQSDPFFLVTYFFFDLIQPT